MKKGIDYIGVGVGALLIDERGRIFLAKRGREARNESGKWEFPGGGVEFGDTLEETLVREMMEEYGLSIQVGKLLDVCDHIIPEEHQHWVSPSFICTVIAGTPTIREPHKCEQIGWFTVDEIKRMDLSLVSRFNFENYLKRAL